MVRKNIFLILLLSLGCSNVSAMSFNRLKALTSNATQYLPSNDQVKEFGKEAIKSTALLTISCLPAAAGIAISKYAVEKVGNHSTNTSLCHVDAVGQIERDFTQLFLSIPAIMGIAISGLAIFSVIEFKGKKLINAIK